VGGVVSVGSWTHCLTKYCVFSSSDFLVIAFKPQVKWKIFKSRSVLFYTTITLEELHRLLSLLLLPPHNHVSAMFLFRSSVSLGLGLPPVPRLRDVFWLGWFYFARYYSSPMLLSFLELNSQLHSIYSMAHKSGNREFYNFDIPVTKYA